MIQLGFRGPTLTLQESLGVYPAVVKRPKPAKHFYKIKTTLLVTDLSLLQLYFKVKLRLADVVMVTGQLNFACL